eukprot:scaffold18781_cov103-Isochrysis_galbana.AAC.2
MVWYGRGEHLRINSSYHQSYERHGKNKKRRQLLLRTCARSSLSPPAPHADTIPHCPRNPHAVPSAGHCPPVAAAQALSARQRRGMPWGAQQHPWLPAFFQPRALSKMRVACRRGSSGPRAPPRSPPWPPAAGRSRRPSRWTCG